MARMRAETVLHGGDLDAARRQFPRAPEPWIDLSTGVNPQSYQVPELATEIWSRLPQPSSARALREVAARRYGAATPERIVAAAGTQALIQIIPRLVGQSRVAVLGPTYREHAAAWRREGHQVIEISDLASAKSARVVVVVNPNNPTGRVVPADELRDLAATLDQRDGFLVVDEAFADVMAPEISIISGLPRATLVLRSFGKTYGLAGLRLGFGIAHEEIALRLRDLLGPWSVSGPAIAVGVVALADDRWLKRSREKLESGGLRLDALLQAAGCAAIGGTPLFRLVSHPKAQDVVDALGRHGIHVRHFSEQPAWLRFGLPRSEQAWQRLELALRASKPPA